MDWKLRNHCDVVAPVRQKKNRMALAFEAGTEKDYDGNYVEALLSAPCPLFCAANTMEILPMNPPLTPKVSGAGIPCVREISFGKQDTVGVSPGVAQRSKTELAALKRISYQDNLNAACAGGRNAKM
jgi:hypothetical protein